MFSQLTENPGSLQVNTLEYSWEEGWTLLEKEWQRCLPGSFGTFIDKFPLHDVQLLISSM